MKFNVSPVQGIVFSVFVMIALPGCGGTKVLKDPPPLVLAEPLASNADQRLEASLDWVVVRDGPGTWARNADWDEYLLRVNNLSGERLRLTGIAVYDSLDFRQETIGDRKQLVKASRATTKRYKNEGLTVKAGMSGGALIGSGAVALTSGTAIGAAALGGSTAAAGAAGAAVAGIFVAPVLMTGGIVRSANTRRVAKEIMLRQVDLPVDVAPGAAHEFSAFFPLMPSPRMIELRYVDLSGEHQLILDTRVLLHGLHSADGAPNVK